jgi:glycosyltransferase involved in cell wall biosynthesis
MTISAVIITLNEERNIDRCLRSLYGVVDEIVVIDSFSKDKTEEICRAHHARFIQQSFLGHIQQKNFAIDQASCEWILSLDADEALSEELRNSILTVKSTASVDGYRMNRLTNYCGHWVKHCGWYPDTKLRLVKKNNARWKGVNPHDRLEMNANEETGWLSGDLLHYSYYTKEDHLRQIEYFGDIAARELYLQGGKSSWVKIIFKTIAQFIKSFVIKRGFLDGKTGFVISRLSAFATFRKYIKLKKLYEAK